MGECNLAGLMRALLPAGLRRLLDTIGAAAGPAGARVYLVGGTVRDLLLGQANFDLDLVVEGDAAALAHVLSEALAHPVLFHPGFGTAKLALPWRTWDAVGDPGRRLADDEEGLHIDLAAARTETYPAPGALPDVTVGADLAADLRRRDFATNAMAAALATDGLGRLIDPFGGADDLAAGRLAVLHPASFDDDPTRLLRGVRLAGRAWLRFAPATEALVREAIRRDRLALVSSDRRRHELELLLAEDRPALALAMARTHGLLEQIHPALGWDEWLAGRLARSATWVEALPRARVRTLLLAYRWPLGTIEGYVALLRPDGDTQVALEALPRWHERRDHLARAATGSAVADLLDGLPRATLAAARLAEDEPALLRNLDWYVLDLSRRAPRLDGHALRALGLPPGPRYRPILKALRRAVLDGELADEAAEWALLKRLVDEQ